MTQNRELHVYNCSSVSKYIAVASILFYVCGFELLACCHYVAHVGRFLQVLRHECCGKQICAVYQYLYHRLF